MTEELFRRALVSVPTIRGGLEALEGATRFEDADALARRPGSSGRRPGPPRTRLMP